MHMTSSRACARSTGVSAARHVRLFLPTQPVAHVMREMQQSLGGEDGSSILTTSPPLCSGLVGPPLSLRSSHDNDTTPADSFQNNRSQYPCLLTVLATRSIVCGTRLIGQA